MGLVLLGGLALSPATALADGTISGVVTDAVTHAPIPNVFVELYDPTWIATYSAETDANGRYSFPTQPAGSYHVGFWAAGYLGQFYKDEPTFSQADPVQVGDANVTGIDAALTTGGHITGTVTDAISHARIADIEVDAYNSSGNIAGSACSGPDGTYTIRLLETGSYQVGFKLSTSCGGTANYQPLFYDQKSSLAGADPVAVKDGSTTSGIDAALAAGGRVTGTVTDAVSHASIQDIEVDAYDSDGSIVDSTCTVADGTYMLRGLATGTYRIGFTASAPTGCATNPNYLPQYFNDQRSLASADPVTVTAGSVTSKINAAMAAGGVIAGTVTDSQSGAPVPGIEVDLDDSAGNQVADTCTGGDGSYSFAGLATGSYSVEINDDFYGPCGPVDCYSSQIGPNNPLAVTAGETTSAEIKAVGCPSLVNGTVTDAATGAAIQGVTVTGYDASGNVLASATTDSTGAYTLWLPAGYNPVRVGFSDGPDYVSQFYNDKPTLASAAPVTLQVFTEGGSEGAFGIDAALAESARPPAGGSAARSSSAVSAATAAKPIVTHLRETHRRFRAGSELATFARAHLPLGTTFSFTLGTASTVQLYFIRSIRGRRIHGKCGRRTRARHNPSCKRTVLVASLTYGAAPGTHDFRFEGRISPSTKLGPGHYELVVVAIDAATRSQPRSISFTIVR